MKPMSDRKMDMKSGQPNSEGFFPENAQMKALPRASEIKGFKYPDVEEMIHSDQQQGVKSTSNNLPKAGFRH